MKKYIISILLGLVLVGCTSNTVMIHDQSDMNYNFKDKAYVSEVINENVIKFVRNLDKPEEEIHNEKTNRVTLTAVGDIMFHIWQLSRGYNKETKTFDFSDSFKYVKRHLKYSDITVGNLETTLAGKNNGIKIKDANYYHGYQGYPCFNTPRVLAKNLKEVGFDLLTTANNHSMDSWGKGVKTTLDTLDHVGIDHVGTYRTKEESQKTLIKTINNINFAFIGYTYGTNGINLPYDEPYLVNTLDMYNKNKINELVEDVKKADETKADFVVVMIHFGNEYFDFPNAYQKDIVNRLFEAGADVILGSHPHVLQPVEIRDIQQDDGTTKKGVVIYSLGNFISSQRFTVKNPSNTDIGVIMDIDFKKVGNEAEITGITLVPTATYWSLNEISVLPVDETLANLEESNIQLDSYELKRFNYAKEKTIKHLLSYIGNHYSYNNYEYYIPVNYGN